MEHKDIPMTDADKKALEALHAVVAKFQPMEPTRENVRAAIIATAEAFVGIEEIGTSNTGYWVNIMHDALGLAPGQPWCMLWVQYVYWFASKIWNHADLLPQNSAGTRAMWFWAQRNNLVVIDPALAKPADILILADGQERTGHTEILTAIAKPTMDTIGGNTNDEFSREGGHCARHTMPISKYGPWAEPRTAKRWTRGVISFDNLFTKYWGQA